MSGYLEYYIIYPFPHYHILTWMEHVTKFESIDSLPQQQNYESLLSRIQYETRDIMKD